jgi:hypothetical protein
MTGSHNPARKEWERLLLEGRQVSPDLPKEWQDLLLRLDSQLALSRGEDEAKRGLE